MDDDLEREVAFYNMTLALVQEGREKVLALKEKFKRPGDFFCEMLKSDAHMARVKDDLIFQQKKMEALEKRKERQQTLKFSKAVQERAKMEKAEQKKAGQREVAEWRAEAAKKRGSGALLDDDKGDDFPGAGGGPNKKPRKSFKQLNKDKKWGFGGRKRGLKKNDSKSIADLSGFNPTRGKKVPAGAKGKKGGAAKKTKGRR